MVFPRKGFPDGLIVHNGQIEDFLPAHSGCHVYHGGPKHSLRLVVQPYRLLLDHLREACGWEPVQ